MNKREDEAGGFFDATGPGKPRPVRDEDALGAEVVEDDAAREMQGQERARLTQRVLDAWDAGEFTDEQDVETIEGDFRQPDGSIDLGGANIESLRVFVSRLAAADDDKAGDRTLVESPLAGMTVAEAEASKAFDDDMGLYGASVEDAAKRVAAARGLELMGQRIRKSLRRNLTDHELAGRGQELAELVGQKAGVEGDKKAANARYNARIKDLDEQIETLAKPIEAGADEVLVDCCLLADFAMNQVHVVRLDTDVDVETRALTGPERDKLAQPMLPFDAGADVAAQPAPRDPNAPPLLEQGYHPAAMRTDPPEVPSKGLVTAGCAEHATFHGAHTMGGHRWACYDLDGHRYAFVAWPEGAPASADIPLVPDEGPAQVGEGWRGTDPALVEKARTNLAGIQTAK